eukprot:4410075-Amphidinium_carterae.2
MMCGRGLPDCLGEVSKQPIGAVLGDVFDLLEALHSPENYGLVDRTFNLVVAAPPYDEVTFCET